MKTSKKFAMMLMGSEYNTKKDYVVMQTESTETHIFTVNTPEQAVELAGQLAQQGFGGNRGVRRLWKGACRADVPRNRRACQCGVCRLPSGAKGAVRPILESAVTLDSCCRYIIGRKTQKQRKVEGHFPLTFDSQQEMCYNQ